MKKTPRKKAASKSRHGWTQFWSAGRICEKELLWSFEASSYTIYTHPYTHIDLNLLSLQDHKENPHTLVRTEASSATAQIIL